MHIADFTRTGGIGKLRPELAELAEIAQEAEAGGIARLTVTDDL